jgi:hypothetical protein
MNLKLSSATKPTPSKYWNMDMKKSLETVGQAWIRELSLVDTEAVSAAAVQEAQLAILAVIPTLGMDRKALHFAVQGYLVAKCQVSLVA